MFVVGLNAPMHGGKTTTANLLIQRCNGLEIKAIRVSFADPLKEIAKSLGWNGLKDKKGRRLLQLLGTELCRRCIDDDYWINKMRERLFRLEQEGYALVVIDDLRFPNEAKVCDASFYITGRERWYNKLPLFLKKVFLHPSEWGVQCDNVIHNTGGFEKLSESVADAFYQHIYRHVKLPH